MPDYMTRPELAAMLRLAVATLESPRFRSTGPRYYRVGRAIRFLRADVQEWLASRQVEVASHAGA